MLRVIIIICKVFAILIASNIMKINSQISTHNIIYSGNELFVVGSSKNTNSFVFSTPDIFFNNHNNIWLMSCPCSAHGMTTDIISK